MKISKYFNNLISLLIFTFPILIIIGPLALNVFSIIMSIYVFININEFKKLIFLKKKIFLGIILIFIFIFPFNDVNSKIVESQILFNSSIFKFFSFLRYILMCFGIIIFLKLFSSDKLFLTKVKNYYILYAVIIIIDVSY